MSSFAVIKPLQPEVPRGRRDLFDLCIPGAALHGGKLRQELKPGRNLDTESEAEERRLLTVYSQLARFAFLSTPGLLAKGGPQWPETSHIRH